MLPSPEIYTVIRRLRLLTLSAALLMSVTAIGSAQIQIPTSGNVFFGYSYSRGETFSPFGNSNIGMNGWEGSAEGKFLPWIGIVGDFDWHYGGNTEFGCAGVRCNPANFRVNASRHEVLFGPRASISLGRYRPFAEFLLGFAHQSDSGGPVSNSDTSFATAVGGGLDYKLIKGVAARVEFDSVRSSLFGDARNYLRVSTGISFKF